MINESAIYSQLQILKDFFYWLMQKSQITFQFPKDEDLHKLNGIKTTQELKNILRDLRQSVSNCCHRLSYTLRQWQNTKNRTQKHLSVYFTCCSPSLASRPSLHFTWEDQKGFFFEGRSILMHHHVMKHKKRTYKRRKTKFIGKNFSFPDLQISSSQKSWRQDENQMVQQFSMRQQEQPDEEISAQESDSWQEKEMLEKKRFSTIHKRQRFFSFPTLEFLQKIQTINSVSVINSKLSHFIRIKCYELKQIRHQSKIYSQQNQNGERKNFIMIQFQCCKKDINKKPYLRYEQNESGVFHLKDYHILHDHHDGRGRKKILRLKKQVKKIKEQEQKMKNKSQKNILPLKTSLIDFILKDHQLMRMTQQENHENLLSFLNENSIQQKNLKEQFIKNDHLMLDEKYQSKNNKIIKQVLIKQTKTKKDHPSSIVKTSPQTHQSKSDQIFSAFHRKQKIKQKIIIELSSQSQIQVEKQNQKQNQSQKLLSNQKITSQTESLLITQLEKKRQKKKIFQFQQRKQKKNIDKQNSIENKKNQNSSTPHSQQNLKKVTVYSWLQRYNDQVSKFVLLKPSNRKVLKDNFHQQIQSLFYEYFQSAKKFLRQQTQQILDQCVFKMMLWNNYQIAEISNLKTFKSKSEPFKLDNKIFFKRFQDKKKFIQKQKRNFLSQNIQIYLAVYPIQITTKSDKIKVFIAYTLTYELYPNILWFYVFGKDSEHQQLENFSKEDIQKIIFYEVLNEAIKYFNLKKVNFIFTTLDCQLMEALDRMCQTSLNNKKVKLESTMHFSCIQSPFQIDNILQNSQLVDFVSNRIKNSKDTTSVDDSCRALKNFFSKENQMQTNKSLRNYNPRVIYQNYRTFAKTFEFKNSQLQPDISTAGMSMFSSQLLYNKKQKVMIEDSVSQLNSLLTDCNRVNHISEFFALILRHSDSNFRKITKASHKTQIVPSYLIGTVNQYRNFYDLSGQNKNFEFSIQNIFQNPNYEMLQIIRNCPRFITQTIYRLIIAANQLSQKTQKRSQELDKKIYIYEDIHQRKTKYLVVPTQNSKNQNSNQKDSEVECLQQRGKNWKCSCNFYEQTGIPCEHEILTALLNKDSLFKEIHFSWKNKYT